MRRISAVAVATSAFLLWSITSEAASRNGLYTDSGIQNKKQRAADLRSGAQNLSEGRHAAVKKNNSAQHQTRSAARALNHAQNKSAQAHAALRKAENRGASDGRLNKLRQRVEASDANVSNRTTALGEAQSHAIDAQRALDGAPTRSHVQQARRLGRQAQRQANYAEHHRGYTADEAAQARSTAAAAQAMAQTTATTRTNAVTENKGAHKALGGAERDLNHAQNKSAQAHAALRKAENRGASDGRLNKLRQRVEASDANVSNRTTALGEAQSHAIDAQRALDGAPTRKDIRQAGRQANQARREANQLYKNRFIE